MGSLSIFYNKFYKKVIIFIFLTLTLISFKNDIPYPMLIEFDETVKNDERISNLTNACFVKESMGGSYFAGYASIFAIQDYENFRFNPGLFIGKEIDNYEKFNVHFDDSDTRFSLIQPITDCKKIVNTDKDWDENWNVVKNVSADICQELAPHIEEKCLSSFYIDVYSRSKSGSWTGLNASTFGIYGLFDLDEIGLSIVPLKYFWDYNEGLNYLWFKEKFNDK